MDVRVGLWRKLSAEELMLLNCGVKKTLESPLDCREIQPVHPKDQSWVFIGRTDVEAETPVLWPPDGKNWLIGKDPDAGRDWGQEEKGTTEDEMAGWHHQLDGHEFEWSPGVGDGQAGLACCDSWGRKESDTTEWLNWLTDWCRETSLVKKVSVCFMPSPISAQNEVYSMLLILSQTNLNQIIPPALSECPETIPSEILHSCLQSGSWDES